MHTVVFLFLTFTVHGLPRASRNQLIGNEVPPDRKLLYISSWSRDSDLRGSTKGARALAMLLLRLNSAASFSVCRRCSELTLPGSGSAFSTMQNHVGARVPLISMRKEIGRIRTSIARQKSCLRFWALDVSGGAGSISSPVMAEHQKNSAEAALLYERITSSLLEGASSKLLLTLSGILTRVYLNRETQKRVRAAIKTCPELQQNAELVLQKVRTKVDDRIQSTAPELFRSGIGFTTGIKYLFESLDDEILQPIREVAEAEAQGRLQQTVADLVQLNESSAKAELDEIMRSADADGNGLLSLDEFWELVTGLRLDPVLESLAQNFTVLRSEGTSKNRREYMASLFMVPVVKGARKLSVFLQKLYPQKEAIDKVGALAQKLYERTELLVATLVYESRCKQQKLCKALVQWYSTGQADALLKMLPDEVQRFLGTHAKHPGVRSSPQVEKVEEAASSVGRARNASFLKRLQRFIRMP